MPELLARFHADFEKLHPFLDGNGRAGRLLLNLALVRLGFPPVIILKQQRPHTSPLWRSPTAASTDHWANSWPGPCSTTSTASSCPMSLAQRAWSRSSPSPTSGSASLLYARRPGAVV